MSPSDDSWGSSEIPPESESRLGPLDLSQTSPLKGHTNTRHTHYPRVTTPDHGSPVPSYVTRCPPGVSGPIQGGVTRHPRSDHPLPRPVTASTTLPTPPPDFNLVHLPPTLLYSSVHLNPFSRSSRSGPRVIWDEEVPLTPTPEGLHLFTGIHLTPVTSSYNDRHLEETRL